MDGSATLVTSLGRARLGLGLGLQLGLQMVEDPRLIKVPVHNSPFHHSIPPFHSTES